MTKEAELLDLCQKQLNYIRRIISVNCLLKVNVKLLISRGHSVFYFIIEICLRCFI